MVKLLFVRTTGALGMTALALFLVGLMPFLSVDPSAAGISARTPAVSVNRALKGDRLPLPSRTVSSLPHGEFSLQRSQSPQEIPDGCDAAFSPISSPRLAYVYGRCTT